MSREVQGRQRRQQPGGKKEASGLPPPVPCGQYADATPRPLRNGIHATASATARATMFCVVRSGNPRSSAASRVASAMSSDWPADWPAERAVLIAQAEHEGACGPKWSKIYMRAEVECKSTVGKAERTRKHAAPLLVLPSGTPQILKPARASAQMQLGKFRGQCPRAGARRRLPAQRAADFDRRRQMRRGGRGACG